MTVQAQVEQKPTEAMASHAPAGSTVRGLASVAMRHGRGPKEPVIFDHTVTGSYEKLSGVKGIELYDGRALGATEPGDEIHLPSELQADFPAITEHYQAIGLEVTKNVAWGRSLIDLIDSDPTARRTISVFLFGKEAHAVSPDKERYEAVRRLNDKNNFIRDMQAAGLPVPRTRMLDFTELPPQEQPDDGFGGPWFVKGAVAASGMEVVECNTWDEVLKASAQMEAHYQVQNGVDAEDFLNVQYYVTDGEARHIATTGQILNGSVHTGNRHPVNHDGVRIVTDAAAEIAAQMGAKEIIAFDVAAVKPPKDNTPHQPYQLIECNPRSNGASYPTAVAEKLGVLDAEWAAVTMNVSRAPLAEKIDSLDKAHITYNPETKTGAVIVNWGTSVDGKLGMLFVGPPTLQEYQRRVAEGVLGPKALTKTAHEHGQLKI